MLHLVDSFTDRPSRHGRRPSRPQFSGVNWQSPQAVGLQAWFPLMGAAGGPEKEILQGHRNTVVGSAPVSTFDREFGPVATGGGDGAGGGVDRVVRIANHAVLKPFSMTAAGIPWAQSFWFKTLSASSGAVNQVIFSYNTGSNPWPGSAITLDTSNQLACNTESATLVDAGFKSTMNPYDQKWHHVLFVQIPSGVTTTYSSTNIYYIDGVLDASSATCAQAGDPGSRDMFFMGDELASPPLGGWMTDFRLYAGLKDLAFARHLYNPATRWDLYAKAPLFLGKASAKSAALTGTALAGITETDIVAGGKTILVTVTGDTFVSL